MKCKGRFFLMSVCLLFISVTAAASDYKSWIPLLLDALGSMGRSGKPDGVNMETNGQKWSSLHQKYSADNGGKSVEMTLDEVEGRAKELLSKFRKAAAK